MIELIIKAKSKLGENGIETFSKNLKFKARMFMKKMGTTVEVCNNKTLVINLNQIQLKALTTIRSNPLLRKQYEYQLKEKALKDYNSILFDLGLVENTDYVILSSIEEN